ncbi:ARM repeat-containing protein [Xylariaceae sp. FL0804]|nr:ARM repeat-containing protein [Xylariaceae sp. FL0804]
MDFLKSAVASAISQGPPFPYTFGDKVDVDASIWALYNGTRRSDGSNCSIFSFDVAANRSRLPLAKNALKKLRTMRHPGVIKVLDTVETDAYIYIATERLVPLRWHVRRRSLSPETIKWGLYSIARTVKFINEEGSSIHGSLRASSVYTSESGEWRLGGFEVLSNVKDDEAVIYTYGSLVPDSARYTPPELARSGWDAIKKSPHSAVDAYNFGTTIFEVFNGDFMGADQAGQTKGIPPTMHAGYRRLVNANPRARITVGAFLEQGRRSGGFFDSSLIKLTDGIDNLGVKTEEERERFLDDLDQLSDDFPEDFFKMKVLPELLKSVEFGGGGPKAFGVVMKISTKLASDDFEARVQPVVVRLFSNPDRAIRVCLLDNLPLMIDRLPQKVVNDKIFPNLVSGFTDVAPVVREQTLKSVLVIISKLSDRTINGELLRYLAKTANDEQPGIRTNTTICLGKIAKNLGNSTRSKVLIAAFTRSLRDPFVHARNAALLALAATSDHFSDEDCATRVLPAICPSLIDKEKLVRDQANKTMEVYMQKIRKAAAGMPDTVLPPPQAAESAGPRMSTPQPSESSSSWAGWAISSFTNKMSAASGEMQTSGNGVPTPTGPRAASPATAAAAAGISEPRRSTSASASASALHRQALKSPDVVPPPPLSRASSAAVAAAAESLFQDPDPADAAEEDDYYDDDAWGNMGDMDDDEEAGDAWGEDSAPSALMAASAKKKKEQQRQQQQQKPVVASPKPFDDDDEPDFAGWLAAQAQKKKGGGGLGGGGGGGRPLPKGLAKSGSSGGGAVAKKQPPAAKQQPVVAKKKIDLKPKDTGDDGDDGWGDGW